MSRLVELGLGLLFAGGALAAKLGLLDDAARLLKPAPEPVAASNPWSKNYKPRPVVFYADCDAARAAHTAPIHRGEPGYSSDLDRDGDGIACEPYHGG
jgi:hypothetical protein